MKYYLGMDCGGTSTKSAIYNNKGELCIEYVCDSMHYLQVGYEGIVSCLNQIKDYFKDHGYDITDMNVLIGLAGYGDNLEVRKKLEESVYAVMPQAVIVNDARLAQIASLGLNDGVFLISGTGSIAFRQKGDEVERRGGYGYMVDDEGSAFWIGKQCLAAFTKEADGQLPKTQLYDCMMNAMNLKQPYDIVIRAQENKDTYRKWVASISGIMATCESPHLDIIWEETGKVLANLVNSFDIKESTPLAFGGSVIQKNKAVQASFIKHCNPLYEIIINEHDHMYGAYKYWND